MAMMVRHEEHAVLEPHGPVVHVEHALSYIVEGSLHFECGESVRAAEGSVVLVPAGIPHRSLEGSDLSYWMLGFCSSCLSLDETMPSMEPFRRVRQGGLPVVQIPVDRREWLVSLFRELQRASADAAGASRVAPLLDLMLQEIRGQSLAVGGAGGGDSLVARALEYVRMHGFEPISLREVAAAVHRSPAHVATTVKKATGHTVGEWLTAQRVAEAARWLGHTDASLDEVAERVGWKDKTHLIRMFKRAYGVTPAAYRRTAGHGVR